MAATMMTSLPQFNGLRPKLSPSTSPVQSLVAVQPMKRRGKGALVARYDFIGLSINLIMVASTSLMLFASRFGLTPSANRKSNRRVKA